jgi:putative two-component system response regulator
MRGNPKILLVDDEPNNLKLLQQILKPFYHLIFANCGNKAIEAAKSHQPDLILLDIMMPDISGIEVCQTLKADPQTSAIPVIFVTAMGQTADEAEGFDVGAVDYLRKPVSAPIVLRRVKTHLSLVKAEALENLVHASILMLGEAGHYNDTDTGNHIWRMSAYAAALAHAAGWSYKDAQLLEWAAPMHDTGKIGIPDEILKAPRKLTADEWQIMKGHSKIGYDILRKSPNEVFVMAAEIALGHHERYDGSGYPQGLAGKDIPESARIVAIADVFDALTMVRPYKEAWPDDKAFELIEKDAGSHFDPDLVEIFLSIKDKILAIKDKWAQTVHHDH